ncbi:N-acetylmuramoyl-L-alanine amidase CwlA [Paenibacillus anaericanus]|uniref:peptidoglycan recognition protein family protein n=1 Tax=Paenibacillus anaericanus TaxID=170367 RepID=UPI002788391F|nr:N-acetylmuramoyl-L-alanine amidase [Paenibacillus anaericanus]MDQ0091682.1 N-acetylmuramoyl-L-alanine amidase CwlA [Paenibacillus anaericanus]
MIYRKDYIPKETACNRRPSLSLDATTITIHNTGNPSSTAANERAWLTNPSNTRQASFHIVIDSNETIECLPLNECAWHAGDGSKAGSGNRSSFGIEICESGNYAKTLDNAIMLVAGMLKERGWGVDRLRRHYDWSGKICPRLMYDNGKWTGWTEFKNRVAAKLAGKGVDEVTRTEYETLSKRITEFEEASKRIAAPAWFVKEFGSANLKGKISDPNLTFEGWRTLAISLRVSNKWDILTVTYTDAPLCNPIESVKP